MHRIGGGAAGAFRTGRQRDAAVENLPVVLAAAGNDPHAGRGGHVDVLQRQMPVVAQIQCPEIVAVVAHQKGLARHGTFERAGSMSELHQIRFEETEFRPVLPPPELQHDPQRPDRVGQPVRRIEPGQVDDPQIVLRELPVIDETQPDAPAVRSDLLHLDDAGQGIVLPIPIDGEVLQLHPGGVQHGDQTPVAAGAGETEFRAVSIQLEIFHRIDNDRLVPPEPVDALLQHQTGGRLTAERIDRPLQSGGVVLRRGGDAELFCLKHLLILFLRPLHRELLGTGREILRQRYRFRLLRGGDFLLLNRRDGDVIDQSTHTEMGVHLQRIVIRIFRDIHLKGDLLLPSDRLERQHSGVAQLMIGRQRTDEQQKIRLFAPFLHHLRPQADPVTAVGLENTLRQTPHPEPLRIARTGIHPQGTASGKRILRLDRGIPPVVSLVSQSLLEIEHHGLRRRQRYRSRQQSSQQNLSHPCSSCHSLPVHQSVTSTLPQLYTCRTLIFSPLSSFIVQERTLPSNQARLVLPLWIACSPASSPASFSMDQQ